MQDEDPSTFRIVVLTLQRVSQSPGGLVPRQTDAPAPLSF